MNSAEYLELKSMVEEYCSVHNIAFDLNETNSVDKFIEERVESIPAIRVNGSLISGPSNNEIMSEFGKLPTIRTWINKSKTHA